MITHFGEKFKAEIIQTLNAPNFKFEGCSPAEIAAAMEAQNVKKLPCMFYEYLETMGKAGLMSYEISVDWRCDILPKLKEWLLESMDEAHEIFELPNDVFVFYSYVGVHYLYILTEQGDDDSPVYFYKQGHLPSIFAKNLSEYFAQMLEQAKIMVDKLRS